MLRLAYARRGVGFDAYGHAIATTFISSDRADQDPLGWQHGYFEDGHVWEGYRLRHVYEPSWRVSAPVRLCAAEDA